MNNYQQITQTTEALGTFLRSLPVVEGPWDAEFQARFCAGCPAENCDACPHGAARNNPGWWLALDAGAVEQPPQEGYTPVLTARADFGATTERFSSGFAKSRK